MKILIFGAGSIGTFLGTKLYNAGYDVTLYGRRKLKKVHNTILINGKLYKTPLRIYKLGQINYDIIFVTTKLYDTQKAVKQIKKKAFNPKFLVFIQNGLVEKNFYHGIEKRNGFVTISVFEGYRLIENQLLTTKSKLGWQTENNDAGRKICEYLNKANINCTASQKLPLLRAEKMMLVNAVGALSAIEKMTLGELMNNKRTKDMVEKIFHESYEVLKYDYNLPKFEDVRKNFYQTMSTVKKHYSSMYQDITSDRKTEINFLNGLIVKLGKKKHIPTPINKEIYDKIQEITKAH